jgi:integrase
MEWRDRELEKIAEAGRYRDPNSRGLYLQVSGPTAKSWILRYTVAGRTRDLGLGGFPAIGVKAARELALKARFDIEQGTDPLAQRAAQSAILAARARRQLTFKSATTAFLDAHSGDWKNAKHKAQWSSTLSTYAFPVLGQVPVSEITAAQVLEVLSPIWPKKRETASRVRQRIEAILDYATAQGSRTGDNPARWKGNMKFLLPSSSRKGRVSHHTAMPVKSMPKFFQRLSSLEEISALALKFTILTVGRTGEVIGAKWGEIEDNVWSVPAERMKCEIEHHVPLPGEALKTLVKLAEIRRDEFVFPGLWPGHHLSNMAMLSYLKKSLKVKATVHGFRSSFRDWAHELGLHDGHVEQCLAHNLGGETKMAYLRSTAFRARQIIMQDWAKFLTQAGSE